MRLCTGGRPPGRRIGAGAEGRAGEPGPGPRAEAEAGVLPGAWRCCGTAWMRRESLWWWWYVGWSVGGGEA